MSTPLTAPTLLESRPLGGGWTMLPAWAPLPGLGVLAINSFLLKGKAPVLVDTGLGVLGDAFLAALEREIDPDDLAWIWISHADADHIGNLAAVLERAPKARIAINFLGAAKLELMGFDLSRVQVLEPGQVFDAGGRRLHPLRPPYYDAPETTGFFDPEAKALFVADCFGALLPAPVASVEDAAVSALNDGMALWSSIDAPWLATADRAALNRCLGMIERLDPDCVLSAHLPPLGGRVSTLTRPIAETYGRGAGMKADPLAVEAVLTALGRMAEVAA